jgi:hypothetical protein
MPVELACSQCNGRLLVDQFGVVVACPHCAAHLSIPAELNPAYAAARKPPAAAVSAPVTSPPAQPQAPMPAPPAASQDNVPDFLRPPATDHDDLPDFSVLDETSDLPESTAPREQPPSRSRQTPAEPASVLGPVGLVNTEPAVSAVPVTGGQGPKREMAAFPSFEGIEAIDDEPFPNFGGPPSDSSPLIQTDSRIVGGDAMPAISELAEPGPDPSASSITIDTESSPPVSHPPAAPQAAASTQSAAQQAQATQSATAAPTRRGQPSGRKTLPNALVQVWLSYTIIVTFLLVLLAFRTFGTPTSNLESLPDVKPQVSPTGQVERKLALTKAVMPPGHTLALGESQRFGNVRVTPLKVTRGPLSFVHYSTGEPKSETAGPVLKLWLKFENVSDDQTIAPLDAELMYYRTDYRDLEDRPGVHANNFLATPAGKKSGEVVLMYDHLIDGNWDVAGQDLGRELAPGEQLTTFIPSDERGFDELDGTLLWRVHFRKGYSPGGYGVTTLIEVQFTPDDIQTETDNAKPTEDTTV